MKSNLTKMTKRLAALGLALAMGLALGGTALAAESADPHAAIEADQGAAAQPAASTLTDEEKAAARTAARTTYDAAVDAALVDIVTAGGLTQAAVDSYHALRDAERLLEKLDTSAWTAGQLAAYRAAVTKDGVDAAALADLVSQGVLTEADVAAMQLAYGERVTITDLIGQVDTTKADPALVTAITDARTAFGQALQEAGLFNGGQGSQGDREGRDGKDGRSNGDAKGSRGDGSTKGGRGGKPTQDSGSTESTTPAEGTDDAAPTGDAPKS